MLMQDNLYQVCVALGVLLPLTVNGEECLPGWFGPACRFKCHCRDDLPCAPNGDCPGKYGCESIYFGPGCQYLDLINRSPTRNTPAFVSDHNDKTCNPNQEDTSLMITLGIRFPFIWFRVVVNDNEHIQTFTTQLNYKESCTNEKKFIVNNNTVDVSCGTDDVVTAIEIKGKIVPHICDIYISGEYSEQEEQTEPFKHDGRNLALKQPTQQSSNFEFDLSKCQSDNAVDGDTSTDYSNGHCSQTDVEESGPEWSLSFRSAVIIYFLSIYNSNTGRARLQNFTVQTFSKDGAMTHFFSLDYALLWYGTYTTSKTPVQTIKIKQSTTVPKYDRLMTLCEVEAYGETICPGRYGILCDKTCTCKETEVCHVHSGACAPGCKHGFYGSNCSFPCAKDCLLGTCDYVSGICDGCKPGQSDDICKEDGEMLPSWYMLLCIPLLMNIPLVFYVIYWKGKRANISVIKKEEDVCEEVVEVIEAVPEISQQKTIFGESNV